MIDGSIAEDVSPEITRVQLPEVWRRIAEVESGEAELIQGDKAFARVRSLLARIAEASSTELSFTSGNNIRS